jgi:hypothetical protein
MSNPKNENEFSILTEVGVFGELNIKDPTKRKIKKDDTEDLEEMIQESIENNKNLFRKD